jgi:long-chain fatty acid transport protein
MGFASKYKSVAALGGLELSAKLAAMEISPGLAYSITDRIAVGLAYRVTYMTYAAHMATFFPPPPNPGGTFVDTKLDVSGWNLLGVHAGVFAKPTDTTRLGFTYRNKVPVTMKGDTTFMGQAMSSELEFSSPHSFKLGVAQSLLNDQLLLALDLKMALYKNSGKSLAVKTDTAAGTKTSETTLNWKNSYGVHAGAEYRFAPEGFRARLGYSLTQSATSEDHAAPILPPPGLQHSVHVGAGVSYRAFDVDLGGYYLFGSKHAEPAGAVGDYSMNAMLFGLGGTYRI